MALIRPASRRQSISAADRILIIYAPPVISLSYFYMKRGHGMGRNDPELVHSLSTIFCFEAFTVI
ncbi:hypothetical protein skT53_34000 [Effusibacillus dendaii]|uniref:Uncharacterized protein n=1 Tax=Effusibacillus dendaii TaxID=2743772 RepID=A0A7I8DEE1_9BACL|nr:hypothetical protein skT53_34000 [Effusibacillus dendaii]